MWCRVFFLVTLLTLTSCAAIKPQPVKPLPDVQLAGLTCEAGLALLHKQVVQANVQDAQLHPIPGTAYLGINRFLLSLVTHIKTPTQQQAWLNELIRVNQTKWQVEIANLTGQTPHPWHQYVNSCLAKHAEKLVNNQYFFTQLTQMVPPNAYQQWAQIAGIYPITQYFLVPGIKKWHEDVHQQFNQPLTGAMQVYSPEPSATAVLSNHPSGQPRSKNHQPINPKRLKQWLTKASKQHPLKLPQLSTIQLEQLAQSFAPHWAIQQQGQFDLPGTPVWQNNQWSISPEKTTVYWRPSYTTIQGQHLLQLNYFIWFSERPANHWFDILAGNIDGVIWRVTLDTDGIPLLYDTIHSCGCYHTFMPVSDRLVAKPTSGQLEPPLIIQKPTNTIPTVKHKLSSTTLQSAVVAVNSIDHWVLGVGHFPISAMHTYQLKPYDNLRSLAISPQQRKNLFDNAGFIKGTERPERWLFWPSGVPSAGTMRQWGHHATAFIGERYFDDPALIEKLFSYHSEQIKQPKQ
ncbi:hypothetical protein [Spartinivicinus poritis]|uniref:Uncharacterized protein n=1 Tax=Spartinivicinus poritis TaxID=2994640 RepID=A0ABT5U6M0_9GAMM|nr:hypothetical protein [Spartinivicinus sp. A2-2]MDE1462005.1 hypothetical protein [Spartinivicinus sp. A2-2]